MTTNKSNSIADINFIREIAELVNENNLNKIEVEFQGVHVRVSRAREAAPQNIPATATQLISAPMPSSPQANEANKINETTTAPETKSVEVDIASSPNALRSPMVGTIYTAPDPAAQAFVQTGDKITEGQTVFIIEAMKTMNNIPAHKSGTITQILIENEQPVEFGEPLLIIE